jgi:site-specific DNA recombinase
MSPGHTRRRGRIYRYYVTREAIADDYDSCAVTSVPAADVESAGLDQVRKLLAPPELVARTWATAKREARARITEREVTALLPSSPWSGTSCFTPEQARIVQLLVERVDVRVTRSRCGSGPGGSRPSSASCSRRPKGKRRDGAR